VTSIPYFLDVRDNAASPPGLRKTGLTPSFVFFNRTSDNTAITGAGLPPAIGEVGNGLYKFTYDPDQNGEAVWEVDCGASLSLPSDRYLSDVCRLTDSRVQAGISSAGRVVASSIVAGGIAGSDITAIATAAALAVWQSLTSGLSTAGSVGLALANFVGALGTDNRPKVSADTHTAGVTVAAVTSKTGYQLASNGLDSIAVPDIAGDSDGRSTFPKMVRSIFNLLFNRTQQTATQLTVANDAGSAVITMPTSDDGTTFVKGRST
jgi:hypothetical protein